MLKISSTVEPLDKSFIGFAMPVIIGPIAPKPPRRWAILYPIFPAFKLGKSRHLLDLNSFHLCILLF